MNKLAQSLHFYRGMEFDGTDLVLKIMAIRVREIDEFILKWLYETYKNEKNLSELYILSTKEFRKFLIKYLPIYMKEEGYEK